VLQGVQYGNGGQHRRPMQLYETGTEQHVGKRRGGCALLTHYVHHVHAGADIAVRVFDNIQRDPPTIGVVDPAATIADPLHQP